MSSENDWRQFVFEKTEVLVDLWKSAAVKSVDDDNHDKT